MPKVKTEFTKMLTIQFPEEMYNRMVKKSTIDQCSLASVVRKSLSKTLPKK